MFNVIGLESINFQNTNFFDELTNGIKNLRLVDKSLGNKAFFGSDEMNDITDTIKKYTNLKTIFEYDENNACAYIPLVNNNSVLINNNDRELYKHFNLDLEEDILKLSKELNKKELKSYIDFKNAKVHGDFENKISRIGINRELFIDNSLFTNEEIAAIILHEIGHIFTFFEYSDRFISTNQSLSLILKTLDKKISGKNKEIIIKNVTKDKLTKEEYDSLMLTENKEVASVIYLGAEIRNVESELGTNLYDYTSSEFLADQFATRLGAGKHLVTGLEKLGKHYKKLGIMYTGISIISYPLAFFMYAGIPGLITLGAVVTFLTILNILSNSRIDKYDNDYNRYLRIRMQNTEALKNSKLSKEQKEFYVQQNEAINKIIENYNDNKTIIDTISYWVKPGYRKQYDFENLQKSLERLASNKLFDKASKLSTLV